MGKILLDARADPEARDACGATAVIAITNAFYTKRVVEMLRLLCERGVNLSAKDLSGRTALYGAEQGHKWDSSDRQIQVQILRSHGAK